MKQEMEKNGTVGGSPPMEINKAELASCPLETIWDLSRGSKTVKLSPGILGH